MGIPTLKNVLDAWIYQEIIYEVQPEIVIEIGSYNGGFTVYMANLLELLKKGKVVSIDNKNFIIDKELARYVLTYNPNGFLKRMY
ncbi:MAG: hypothetical protein KAV83_10190 [Desulfobacterales bacterium]|nr:hypothetical protein [Desulfobacterales bacterium]